MKKSGGNVVATVKNSENVLRNFPLRHTDVYLKVCAVIGAEELKSLNTNEIGEMAREYMLRDDC